MDEVDSGSQTTSIVAIDVSMNLSYNGPMFSFPMLLVLLWLKFP